MNKIIAAAILTVIAAPAAIIAYVSLKKSSNTISQPGTGNIPSPTPMPGPNPTPSPTPQPAPAGTRTAKILVLAQNSLTRTFFITQQELDSLTSNLPTSGFIQSIEYVDFTAVDTAFDVISWINANLLQPPTIPNLQFNLVAPDGKSTMNNVILTQDDYTIFRAQFPTGIGIYNVLDTNNPANNTPGTLAQFIIAHPKLV